MEQCRSSQELGVVHHRIERHAHDMLPSKSSFIVLKYGSTSISHSTDNPSPTRPTQADTLLDSHTPHTQQAVMDSSLY